MTLAGLGMGNCHQSFLRNECPVFSPATNSTRATAPEEEDRVAGHSHPAQVLHQRRLQELAAAGVPVAVLDRGPGLHQADRQQAQDAHRHQAAVQRPEREPQQAVFPLDAGNQDSQADQHQADAQHSVDAEQRGVTVQRRRVEALHVVQGDRRVDHEAEQPGPDHVPEGHGHEEVDRPLVPLHPRRRSRPPQVFHRIEPDEHQRHDFQAH